MMEYNTNAIKMHINTVRAPHGAFRPDVKKVFTLRNVHEFDREIINF